MLCWTSDARTQESGVVGVAGVQELQEFRGGISASASVSVSTARGDITSKSERGTGQISRVLDEKLGSVTQELRTQNSEVRSSGVQEFRSSGVQEFRRKAANGPERKKERDALAKDLEYVA
jgi:hypothetical protein